METTSSSDGNNYRSTELVQDGQLALGHSRLPSRHVNSKSHTLLCDSVYGAPAGTHNVVGDFFHPASYSGDAVNFQNFCYPQITLPPKNPTFCHYVASLSASNSPHQTFTTSNQTSFCTRAGTLPRPQSTSLMVPFQPQSSRLPSNNQPQTNILPMDGMKSRNKQQFSAFHNRFFSDANPVSRDEVIPSKIIEGMEPDSTTSTKEVSLHINRKKRKACGRCGPCQRKDNCGTCMNCINRAKGKQICVFRKCEELKKKPGTEPCMPQVDRSLENIAVKYPEKRKDLELLLTNTRKKSKTEELISTSNPLLELSQSTQQYHFSTSQQHNLEQLSVQQHQRLSSLQYSQANNSHSTVADNPAGFQSYYQQNPHQDTSTSTVLLQTNAISNKTTGTTDIISEALREIENHSNSNIADVTTLHSVLPLSATESTYSNSYRHQQSSETAQNFRSCNPQYPWINSVSPHLQEKQSSLIGQPQALLTGPGRETQPLSEQLEWSQCNVFARFQKNNSNSHHNSKSLFSNLHSQGLKYATDPEKFSNSPYNQHISASCNNIPTSIPDNIIHIASTFKDSKAQPVTVSSMSISNPTILCSKKAVTVVSSSESIMHTGTNLVPYSTEYSPSYVQKQARHSLPLNAPPNYNSMSPHPQNTQYSYFTSSSSFPVSMLSEHQGVGVENSAMLGISNKDDQNSMSNTNIHKLVCEDNSSSSVLSTNIVTTLASTKNNQMYLQERKDLSETELLRHRVNQSLCGSQVTLTNGSSGSCSNFDGIETLSNTKLHNNPCYASQIYNQEMISPSSTQYSHSFLHSPTTMSFSNSPVEVNHMQQSLVISNMPKLIPSPVEVTESTALAQDQVSKCTGAGNKSLKQGPHAVRKDEKDAIVTHVMQVNRDEKSAESCKIRDEEHTKKSFLIHPGSGKKPLSMNQCHFSSHSALGVPPTRTSPDPQYMSAARYFTSTESNLGKTANTPNTSSNSLIYRSHSSGVFTSHLMASSVNESSVKHSSNSIKSPTETTLTISPGESGYDSTETPLCNDEFGTTPCHEYRNVPLMCFSEVKKENCDVKLNHGQGQEKNREPKNLYRAPVDSKTGSIISLGKSDQSQLNLFSAGASMLKHSIGENHSHKPFISSSIKRSYSSVDSQMYKKYKDEKQPVHLRRYSYQEMRSFDDNNKKHSVATKSAECEANFSQVSPHAMDRTPDSTYRRRMGSSSQSCGAPKMPKTSREIPSDASESSQPSCVDKHLEQTWIKKTIQSEINVQTKSAAGVKRESNSMEFPSCDCILGSEVRDSDAPYYTHLGSAESVMQIRQLFEERTGYSGDAIRIERVKYTGKEGKTSLGCPIAKWIIRRTSEEEKVLIICRKRQMHHCKNSVIVLVILLWDGVARPLADFAYTNYSTYVPENGEPTERRCGTNDEKTCACQGFNDSTCGASFSFGCSWSMYYNGCKFARSAQPNKYKLNRTKNADAEKFVGQLCERLATVMSPLYKMVAPDAFQNQVEKERCGFECRLGENTEPNNRPFSGVTACLDFCAHAHKDQHNMENGSTVVLTLTKPELRTIGVRPKDEQLHVLPLYTLDLTEEPGIGPSVEAKVANGSIEKLSGFRRPVRVRSEPKMTKKQKAKAKKKSMCHGNVDVLRSPPYKRKGKSSKQLKSPGKFHGTNKDLAAGCNPASNETNDCVESIENNYSFQNPPHVQRYIPSSISHHSGTTFTSPSPRWPYRKHNLSDQVLQQSCSSMNEHLPSIGSFFKEENAHMLNVPDNHLSANYKLKQLSSLYTPLPSLKDVVSHPFHQTFATIGNGLVDTNSQKESMNDSPYSSEPGSCFESPRTKETVVASFFPPGDYSRNKYNQLDMQPPANDTALADTVYSDSEESFNDPDIGGVAIAPGHGSVLIECAKKELHATTPLLYPDRFKPSRISLVFYQHKSLNSRNHGAAEYGVKEEKRQQLREEKRREEYLKAQAQNQTSLLRTVTPNHGSYSDSNLASNTKQNFNNLITPHNYTSEIHSLPHKVSPSSYLFDHQSTHNSSQNTKSPHLVNSFSNNSIIQANLNRSFSTYYNPISNTGQSTTIDGVPIKTKSVISPVQYCQFSPRFRPAQLIPGAPKDESCSHHPQTVAHFHQSKDFYPRSHLFFHAHSQTPKLHSLNIPCNYDSSYYHSNHQLLFRNNVMGSRMSHPQQHSFQTFQHTEYNSSLPHRYPATFPYPRPAKLDFSRENSYPNIEKK